MNPKSPAPKNSKHSIPHLHLSSQMPRAPGAQGACAVVVTQLLVVDDVVVVVEVVRVAATVVIVVVPVVVVGSVDIGGVVVGRENLNKSPVGMVVVVGAVGVVEVVPKARRQGQVDGYPGYPRDKMISTALCCHMVEDSSKPQSLAP